MSNPQPAPVENAYIKHSRPKNIFWHHRGVLDHVDDDELPGRVKSFIGENRIPVTYEVLLKGARMIKHEDLARSGRSLSEKQRSIPGLTQADLDLLKTEGHWRHQPLTLYMTVALASVAAIVQGWDQTGTNGANLQWPKEFISGYKATDLTGQNALIVGLVNAAPYIVIAVLACWISDPLNHWLGRRKTIWIGALLSLIAPIASAFTRRWPQLLGCRFLLGAGMGLKEVTVPILSAEIAPPEIRGALVMSWQICTAAGIFLGSIANLVAIEFVPDHPDQRHSNIWRYRKCLDLMAYPNVDRWHRTGLSVYPRSPPSFWDFLLSRVATLADSEKQAERSLLFSFETTRSTSRTACCQRSLLYP